MPYSLNSSNLPEYIKNRSDAVKKKWIAIFNRVYAQEGEQVAFIVANKWLKSKVKQKSMVARTDAIIDTLTFVVDTDSEELITRTENGEDYVSFKLADTNKDKFGVELPESVLQEWADKINSGELVLGDVDHEAFESLLKSGASDVQIKALIKQKPSIAKAVKAIYEKGRLWVRALIDKRYKKLVEKSKGVSLEAAVKRSPDGKVVGGELLGFTFGIKQNPVIPGTEVYA